MQFPRYGRNTKAQHKTHRNTRQRFGGHSEGETPGNIPNPEAKPFSADGTALETVWESRTPPNNHPPITPNTRWGLLAYPPPEHNHFHVLNTCTKPHHTMTQQTTNPAIGHHRPTTRPPKPAPNAHVRARAPTAARVGAHPGGPACSGSREGG